MRLDVAWELLRRAGEDGQERSHLRGARENGDAAQLAEDGRQRLWSVLRIRLVRLVACCFDA